MMNKDICFYDTSSLLLDGFSLIDRKEPFVISSITLEELENIKTSAHKDSGIKYSARKLLHLLDSNKNLFEIVIYKDNMLSVFESYGFDINNDLKILATACYYDAVKRPDETIFVTNDLALKAIANLFFGEDSIKSVQQHQDDYTGFKEIVMDDEEMGKFYQSFGQNKDYNMQINEYLIIKDKFNNLVDSFCYIKEGFIKVPFLTFDSSLLGNIKPVKGDIHQTIAMDSLNRNQFTILRGPAGSGKDQLAWGYMMSQLEKGNLDKIVIMSNPIAVRGAAKLGFYPGDKDTKLLDSQIGNFLNTKLGGNMIVEQLIAEEKLQLIPVADCRGIDLGGDSKVCLYMTEAQNTSTDLMKLILQRAGKNCKVIMTGDDKAQTDMSDYEGDNNGLRRAVEVFRGTELFGTVTLQTIFRSEIAKIAEKM